MGGPDAAAIAGALADDDRRSVFAAVQLGAKSVDDVVAATGLTQARAATALGRLVEMGLVSNSMAVDGEVFRAAAREALARPRSTEHDGLPDATRRVMDAFVVDGRLTSIPAAHAKRLVILDWLAQMFEPGRRYSEQTVNLVLGQRYADTAALRRYLVDEGLMSRESGEYWRSGGSTPP